MECISVEITLDNLKKLTVSCLYRTPGSCLDVFNQTVSSLFYNNSKNTHIVCGDFNIDLLNPQKNVKTSDFISTMYSNSFFPLILKPSRITINTATLIDNIFTNEMSKDKIAGLLINDISDHLPVFSVFYQILQKNHIPETVSQQVNRLRTPEAMAALKADLYAQTWDEVYATSDPDQAYDAFLFTVLKLYDKYCPIKIICNMNTTSQNKPWITHGIANACKKKNHLYRLFMKSRTKVAEKRYKIYKNRLTNIMRENKKNYYQRLLEQHRNNIQGTWKILNDIIKNGRKEHVLPSYFVDNDQEITNTCEIANAFNSFFANVGPSLAKKNQRASGFIGFNSWINKSEF